MNNVFQRLLLIQALVGLQWQATSVKLDRLIELFHHIQQHEDIRSLVMYSQKSYVDRLPEFEKFLHSMTVPLVLIDEDYKYGESGPLSEILGCWITAFVFMESIDNFHMLAVVNDTLRQIHSSKIVFILERDPHDNEIVKNFFKICLRLGIVNVIIMFENQVLSYEPFPSVSLDNLTSTPTEGYFADRLYNLKGYTFYSPIQQDASRVFIYKDKTGTSRITGINTEIFRSFVQRHNATFQRLTNDTNQNSFEISHGMALLGEGKVDILLHTYSYFNAKRFAWSYPIGQVEWQSVVPYVGEIPSYMYLILPFEITVWICLAVSFVYITLAGYLALRYCHQLKEYGSLFSRSLTQFLYLSSTPTSCTLRTLLFEMQIFCYGLILTNTYLAFLSAFLTTTVQDSQIDTFKELHMSGIKILTTSFEAELIRHTDVFRPHYNDIFQIEDMDLVNEYRKSLNRTYAFVMADDRTKFFLEQQKYLEKKRMYVSKDNLGTYFLTFNMQLDSPFRKNFDAVLLQLYQTGLYKKWERDVFDLAVATKYLQIFRTVDEDSLRPLTVSHLFVCWVMYAIGIALSLAVCAAEIVRFKFGKK